MPRDDEFVRTWRHVWTLQRRARGGQKPRFVLDHPGYDRLMWSLVYLLVRTLVARIIGTSKHGHDDSAKDLEILVLRHLLRVPQRTAGRPRLKPMTGSRSRRRAGFSRVTAGSPSLSRR